MANTDDFTEENPVPPVPASRKEERRPPPLIMEQGRTYWDDVDMNATKEAGLTMVDTDEVVLLLSEVL